MQQRAGNSTPPEEEDGFSAGSPKVELLPGAAARSSPSRRYEPFLENNLESGDIYDFGQGRRPSLQRSMSLM